MLNPLPECEHLEICQHEERFEFYLKWEDDRGQVRYSQVNGWEIRHMYFKTLDEATDCIRYIIGEFREHYKCPQRSIEFMKSVPISYSGKAEVGDPIKFTFDGAPCEWKKPLKQSSGPRRGRVSDDDLKD